MALNGTPSGTRVILTVTLDLIKREKPQRRDEDFAIAPLRKAYVLLMVSLKILRNPAENISPKAPRVESRKRLLFFFNPRQGNSNRARSSVMSSNILMESN